MSSPLKGEMMDIDVCLQEIKDLLVKHKYDLYDFKATDVERLCENIEVLDEWMTRGGYKPIAWRELS